MNKTLTIKSLNIQQLLSFIERNNLAVPEFQRDYVWQIRQIRDLFKSLINYYPIGSFIIWKNRQNIEARSIFYSTKRKSQYLIIDGQQRLSTISYLCSQQNFLKVKNEFESICKSIKPIEFERFYFKKSINPELQYSKEHNSEFNFKLFKQKLSRYKFPLIIIKENKYENAVNIFEKINQSGTKISTDFIFLSETWNKKSNLGKTLRIWRTQNKDLLSSKVPNINYIHLMGIIIQLENKKVFKSNNVDVSVKNLKKIAEIIRNEKSTNKYETILKNCIDSICSSISFLKKEIQIKNLNELPSQTLITMLAVFFYYQKNKALDKRLKELKKLFWRSSVGSRYIGKDYNYNISRDPYKLKLLATKGTPLNLPKHTVTYNELSNVNIHTGKSALKNSIKLMMWLRSPKWINNETIYKHESDQKKSKKEDDHFYPFDLYKKNKYLNKDINCLLNVVYLSKSLNGSKGNKLPSVWLKEKRKSIKNYKSEQYFFKSQLLPFKDIKELEKFENKFINRYNSINKNFKSNYSSFLKNRYTLFKKELNLIQNGN
ncbi:MAG TPA: DUF262 domain-containing protein [Ignavibacteria bacterium]|nr:DUF262 domain-containing protein [Ignavibacteria bacterium]HMQ98417.1 DUF262 domain-containing protein [Ignavibacteria bacterium]